MKNPKLALVSAVHIQPSEAWIKGLPRDIPVFIVDDSNGKVKIDLPNVKMFDYAAQKNQWSHKKNRSKYKHFHQKFHKSSACKMFGLWYAYKKGFDAVIMIDSDCVITDISFVELHKYVIGLNGTGWHNTIEKFKDGSFFPRGYPYNERERKIVMHMGLWYGQMDINGADKMLDANLGEMHPNWFPIDCFERVAGSMPISGMNLVIRREAIPAYLLLPNLDVDKLKFRRHDDIFGGYIFQQLIRKLDGCVTFGSPLVYHDSPVEPKEDAMEEFAMNRNDKEFYQLVDKIVAYSEGKNYKELFKSFSKESVKVLTGTKFEEWIDSFKWYAHLYD